MAVGSMFIAISYPIIAPLGSLTVANLGPLPSFAKPSIDRPADYHPNEDLSLPTFDAGFKSVPFVSGSMAVSAPAPYLYTGVF